MGIRRHPQVGMQKQAIRHDGWTLARRTAFLDELARSANTRKAAEAAGMRPDGARELRRRDPAFAVLWAKALDEAASRLIGVAGREVTVDRNDADGVYAGGRLRWFGGPLAGLEGWIAASAGAVVTLRTAPAQAVAAGTLVELIEGCDKSIATCAARFGNAANFCGEPYLPGMDLLTRYPGT